MNQKMRLLLAVQIGILILGGCGSPQPFSSEESEGTASVAEQNADMEENGLQAMPEMRQFSDAEREAVCAIYNRVWNEDKERAMAGNVLDGNGETERATADGGEAEAVAGGPGADKQLAKMRHLVAALGEAGFTAVDCENRVDMVQKNALQDFQASREKGEKAEILVLQPSYGGGFWANRLYTVGGQAFFSQEYDRYDGETLAASDPISYRAAVCSVTEEGYLMLEGRADSAQQYVLTLSDDVVHLALRMEPLDAVCRAYTEKYLAPVSYRMNDLFLVDWSAQDISALNLGDAFGTFYRDSMGTELPYRSDQSLATEDDFLVPREEFEQVLTDHLDVSREILRTSSLYDSQKEGYHFHVPEFGETDYCEVPYPEVVSCEKKTDGTLGLHVNAVFPEENTSRLFTHEVLLKESDAEGGRAKYVSNRMGEECPAEFWWHGERSDSTAHTEKKGGGNKSGEAQPGEMLSEEAQPGEMLSEEAQLKRELRDIEKKTGQVLREKTGEGLTSAKALEKAVKILAAEGRVVTTDEPYAAVENWQQFDGFLKDAAKGKKGELTFCKLNKTGILLLKKYVYDGSIMTVYSSNLVEDGLGNFTPGSSSRTEAASWQYSEDGWFCCQLKVPAEEELTEVVDGSEMQRVLPMSEENRQASEKYVFPIGYQGNNVLREEWNAKCPEKVDFAGVYEKLWEMEKGAPFLPDLGLGGIDAQEFESRIMRYFPVTAKQVQKSPAYEATAEKYSWSWMGNQERETFGTALPEVIKVRKNSDGTKTLTVQAVQGMFADGSTFFTHELTVKDDGTGGFRYLGNHLTGEGASRAPQYRFR